jgi:hypothetical protein
MNEPTYEQDNYGEWQAVAKCGHYANPDEIDEQTGYCVNCVVFPEEPPLRSDSEQKAPTRYETTILTADGARALIFAPIRVELGQKWGTSKVAAYTIKPIYQ